MNARLPRLRGRIILLLVTLLVLLRLGHMAVGQSFNGPGPLQTSADLVIPPGGIAATGAVLSRAGAIRHPLIFRIAVFLTRADGPLHAGEFFIPARSSLADILQILRHGAPVQHQVTIPEGLTGVEIAKIINAAPAASGSAAVPAEGSVLPQTYDFTLGTSRAAILARAQKAMRRSLAAAWAHRAPGLPLQSPQQALILASIVQSETPVAAELPEIAAVYENRLTLGMRLQADPTVIYAASGGQTSGGLAITRADLASPSPYNTYLHAGLPPGPICAPGLAAIQAVLHPAAMQALYFVATGNGGHVFADNFKTQLRNIQTYRATLAAQAAP
ncbi:endolytic transglycosylase MltG [Acidocella sp.]|uniref:endolytic transglycosylase MltG n=1 Tax=Acidocella sp. TaxID=50710 RepID=UPI0017FAAC45|nr:endolytic transglycosylase MltG [Acidocella sp.]NNM55971.1 endolytic transglycosylase MltG [Acidocella sp.]